MIQEFRNDAPINKRIIIVGKGGSGKDYLKDIFVKRGFNSSVSFTTRPPRTGEICGKEYYFCSDEQFQEMIDNNKFFEYKQFNGWFYGTSKLEFNTADVFIMTPPSIDDLSKEDRKSSMIIYLDIEESIRKKRLSNRNDSDSVKRRLLADNKMFQNFTNYDLRLSDPNF